jgi:hypothetical protein
MADPPPPPPPSSRGWLADLITSVFAYIDRPWKAVVVVVLAVLGLAGWIIYEKRDELFEAWLTPDTPELKTAEIPDALEKLAMETDADLVQVWAVDLSKNSQWFIAARRHDGERPVIPTPRRLPIIDHTSDIQRLTEILAGRPVCVALEPGGTPVARRLYERGMKRGCAIPIPPNPDAFVGVIYLAWSVSTDSSGENVAVGAAREISKKLATH